jgi:hypothetical protein
MHHPRSGGIRRRGRQLAWLGADTGCKPVDLGLGAATVEQEGIDLTRAAPAPRTRHRSRPRGCHRVPSPRSAGSGEHRSRDWIFRGGAISTAAEALALHPSSSHRPRAASSPCSPPLLHLRSMPTPAGAPTASLLREGNRETAGDHPLLQHGVVLSPAAYCRWGDGNVLWIV